MPLRALRERVRAEKEFAHFQYYTPLYIAARCECVCVCSRACTSAKSRVPICVCVCVRTSFTRVRSHAEMRHEYITLD